MEISRSHASLIPNVVQVQKNLKNKYLRELNLAENNILTQIIDATIQLIEKNVVQFDTGYWFLTNNYYEFELAQFTIINEYSQSDDIHMFYTISNEDQLINWVIKYVFEIWESEMEN